MSAPVMTNQEFAKKLLHWRSSLGFYQKQAADLFGVPLPTYQGWEYGRHQPVRVCLECVLKKIKENPGLSVKDLDDQVEHFKKLGLLENKTPKYGPQ